MFLSWPHVVSGESVKLTRVDSIFFSIYYDFFFQFHHFALNYFSLSFVIFFALSFFSLLFLVCYFERGLVKLTRISLHFCSQCFFILNSCRMWRVNWVNPSWLGFFSLDFLLRFFLISSFYIKLSFFEIFCFFTFLIVWLFREWVSKVNLDWLRVVLTLFFIEL
jgi:hypothetical protein